MLYRREIDGLRALAVLPVLVFHGLPEWAPGGYIGVDIFFVISGFLITSIIVAELESNSFSILRFYERRARRILPALFAVIAACLPFAWFWMLPYQMKELGQSLVAVAAFGSNFLFWQQSDYFDSSAELRPLLHTWSLAVEEQYYVLFPLFLWAAWRLGRRGLLVTFGMIAALSLGFAQAEASHDRAAAFYLLPSRAWELLVGASLALRRNSHEPLRIPLFLRNLAGFVGLALVAYGIVAFDKNTPFPGVHALVPTVAAALLIACADKATFTGRLLALPVFVNIGLISYSLYLWHFPLLAFWKIRSGSTELPALVFAPYVLLSFALAWLAYRFVETPFRAKGAISRRAVFSFALAGMAALAALGLFAHVEHGFLETKLASVPTEKRNLLVRVDEEVAARRRIAQAHDAYLTAQSFTRADATKIAIAGDSLAQDLSLALAQHRDLFPNEEFRFLHLKTECLDAAPRADRAAADDACAARMHDLLESPLLGAADQVVLTGLWTGTLAKESVEVLLTRLKARNNKLLVLGSGAFLDIPSLSYKVARDDRTWTQDELDVFVATSRRDKFDRGNELVAGVAKALGIPYQDRHQLYCDEGAQRCRILHLDGKSLIWDNAHLTELGFRTTAEKILERNWLGFPARD